MKTQAARICHTSDVNVYYISLASCKYMDKDFYKLDKLHVRENITAFDVLSREEFKDTQIKFIDAPQLKVSI